MTTETPAAAVVPLNMGIALHERPGMPTMIALAFEVGPMVAQILFTPDDAENFSTHVGAGVTEAAAAARRKDSGLVVASALPARKDH